MASMKKELFLRAEYDRIIVSGDYVWSGWRYSYERFQADLWDMTPTSGRSGRFLAPIEAELGLVPGNVEWHYSKVRKPKASIKIQVARKIKDRVKNTTKPKAATPAQKRAAEKKQLQAEKQARREALAAEFMKWENQRRA